MGGKRLWQTLRMFTIMSAKKRTNYLKKKKIFAGIGENCSIQSRIIPLYANLIKLGNNVHVASNVTFITHDIVFSMLNKHPNLSGIKFREKMGCIEIKDNVFVGAGTTILYDVSIGSNVIIGAGSLINKDIPDNCVVAGVPAKIIGNFDDFVEKRKQNEINSNNLGNSEIIDTDTSSVYWDCFYRNREKKN